MQLRLKVKVPTPVPVEMPATLATTPPVVSFQDAYTQLIATKDASIPTVPLYIKEYMMKAYEYKGCSMIFIPEASLPVGDDSKGTWVILYSATFSWFTRSQNASMSSKLDTYTDVLKLFCLHNGKACNRLCLTGRGLLKILSKLSKKDLEKPKVKHLQSIVDELAYWYHDAAPAEELQPSAAPVNNSETESDDDEDSLNQLLVEAERQFDAERQLKRPRVD